MPIWKETWIDKLKKDLFAKYDKFARSTQHFNTTTVSIATVVQNIMIVSILVQVILLICDLYITK